MKFQPIPIAEKNTLRNIKKLNENDLIIFKGGLGCQKYIRRSYKVAYSLISAEQKAELLDALSDAYDLCIEAKYN